MTSSQSLNLHVLIVHEGKKNFKCDICNKDFSSKAHLNTHKRDIHEDDENVRTHECTTCNKKFKSTVYLKTHMEVHENKRHSCEECELTFAIKSSLRKHKRYKHSGKTFRCPFCLKVYSGQEYVKLHIKTLHNNNYQRVLCTLCNQSFATKISLRAHVREIHKRVKTEIKCEFCENIYTSIPSLKNHKKLQHNGKIEDLFECSQCGKTFSTNQSLSRHVKGVHMDKGKFKCDSCGKIISSMSNLTYHINTTHLKKKDSKCNLKHD